MVMCFPKRNRRRGRPAKNGESGNGAAPQQQQQSGSPRQEKPTTNKTSNRP